MQKELNPELFGTLKPSDRPAMENTMNGGRFVQGSAMAPSNFSSWTDLIEQSELRVVQLAQDMKSMQQLTRDLQTQMTELFKTTQGRMDRLQQAIQKLDQNDQMLANEISSRVTQLHSRVGDRKAMDQKLQEMVDRHNSVLKTFEVRLQHMQKVMSEKEGQLLQTTAALNDAKMEIARLKRI